MTTGPQLEAWSISSISSKGSISTAFLYSSYQPSHESTCETYITWWHLMTAVTWSSDESDCVLMKLWKRLVIPSWAGGYCYHILDRIVIASCGRKWYFKKHCISASCRFEFGDFRCLSITCALKCNPRNLQVVDKKAPTSSARPWPTQSSLPMIRCPTLTWLSLAGQDTIIVSKNSPHRHIDLRSVNKNSSLFDILSWYLLPNSLCLDWFPMPEIL